MSNANTIALFGSFDANDRVHSRVLKWELGKPQRVRPQYGGPGVDIAVAGPVDESAWAIARWTIELSDTTVDGVSARVADLSAELRDLSAITVGMPNSAYTGILTPKNADCLERPITAISAVAFAETVEVTVEREAWLYGATETPYVLPGLAAPAVVDLSAQSGQYPAPIDLLLDAGVLTLAGCYVGYTEDRNAVIGDFVKHAVTDLTWLKTGGGACTGNAGVEAAGYPDGAGNTIWGTKDATGDTASIDVTDLSGSYLVLANCQWAIGATGAEIKQEFGEWTAAPSVTLHLVPLGVVSLPTRAVCGASTATLDISIRGNGTNWICVNYVALLPVTDGLTGYVLSSGHVHTLRWEDGTLYADDSVDYSGGKLVGGASSPRTLGGKLVVLAENATPAPTVSLNVIASATPRWEQFPAAGIGTHHTFMYTNNYLSEIAADLAAIRALDVDIMFNYLMKPSTSDADILAWLDALSAAGMRTALSVYALGAALVYSRTDKTLSTSELATIAAYVEKWKTHPAVWGWYADDESPAANYPIATRQEVYDTIKAHHPAGQVVETHWDVGTNYSAAVHDVFLLDVGPSGAAYVYKYDDTPGAPYYGCISKATGLVTLPVNEATALDEFYDRMVTYKALLVAAGETQYAICMQAFGQEAAGSNYFYAMPPAGGITKMWAEVQRAGMDVYGVGWFLWKSNDAATMPGEMLDGVGETAYSAKRAEIATFNELLWAPGDARAVGGKKAVVGDYVTHTFDVDDTLIVAQPIDAEILVVAGGGAGGLSSAGQGGGGGGGGGVTYISTRLQSGFYSVTVGSGGSAANGENSQFGMLTAAVGGGKGGSGDTAAETDGYAGGSGGGGGGNGDANDKVGGAGTADQGNDGGDGAWSGHGGGGGGAGAAGGDATNPTGGGAGGDGVAYSISGASVKYGAGGGGGFGGLTNVNGGDDGGGRGGGTTVGALSGTDGLGAGGGGQYHAFGIAGDGGDGVVIVRYLSV